MRLPRDLSGRDLATRLERRYGYRVTRTKGSPMTATRTAGTDRHSVTVPSHRKLRLGTLDGIVTDVAAHLGVPKGAVCQQLFG